MALEVAVVALGVAGLPVDGSCVLLLTVYTKFRTPSIEGALNQVQPSLWTLSCSSVL